MIEIVPVSCCPWCKKTPSFKMYRQVKTWTPHVVCENYLCSVRPKAPYVPIRKKQIYDAKVIREKILRAIEKWNTGNPFTAVAGFQFDFEQIAQEEVELIGV